MVYLGEMIATRYSNSYNRYVQCQVSWHCIYFSFLFSKWQCTNPLHTGTDRRAHSPKLLEPTTLQVALVHVVV